MKNVAAHVRENFPFALDSDLFGVLDLTLIQDWRRPLLV